MGSPSLRRISGTLVVACLSLPAAALTGCLQATPCEGSACETGELDSTWDEQRELSLAGRTMAEGGIRMSDGDLVEVEFATAGEAVVWNLHSHEGDQRPRLSEGRGSDGAFEFTAPHDGVFWSFWMNEQGEAVTVDVRYRFHGSATFDGWRDSINE